MKRLRVRTEEIFDSRFAQMDVRLLLRREDQIHPWVSGNKFRKIGHNVVAARRKNKKSIVSFGGAFSNHLFALAAAGQICDLSTIGVVRGEEAYASNPTLSAAAQMGMRLHFIDRPTYRAVTQDNDQDALNSVLAACGASAAWYVPEGGSNWDGVMGCAELGHDILQDSPEADVVALPVGCGGTLAGTLLGLDGSKRVLGIACLKGGFLPGAVQELTRHADVAPSWEINSDFHFGGYARFNDTLIRFINDFDTQHGVPLDPVYTGKLLYGVTSLILDGRFPSGTTVLAVHTGGLQGVRGFTERHPGLLDLHHLPQLPDFPKVGQREAERP